MSCRAVCSSVPRPRTGGGFVPLRQPASVRGGARRRASLLRPPTCQILKSSVGARTRTCRRRSPIASAWSWERWSRKNSATRRRGEAGAGPHCSSRRAAGRRGAGVPTAAARGLLGFVVRRRGVGPGAGARAAQALRPGPAPAERRIDGARARRPRRSVSASTLLGRRPAAHPALPLQAASGQGRVSRERPSVKGPPCSAAGSG